MDNSFNCVICLKELNIKDGVLTPCKHRYHSECFFKWIYKKRTCPLCRTELIAPSEDEEFLDELRRQIDWESSIYSTLRNNTTILERRIVEKRQFLKYTINQHLEQAEIYMYLFKGYLRLMGHLEKYSQESESSLEDVKGLPWNIYF